MKLGPVLLLNLLVVGGGIFLYDTLKGDAQSPSDTALTSDATPATPGGLTGSADQKAAHSSEARIRGMEAAIARLQAELETVRSGKGAVATEDEDPKAPVQIDEKTLHWMTAYRAEIIKREGEARVRARMAVEFERKGVDLPADAMERVVRETLAFHGRAKELMRPGGERTAEARRERERAARELRDGYERILRDIAPAEQVELVLKTRIGRAHGILPREDED